MSLHTVPPPPPKLFDGLIGVLMSAAAAVAAVFGLFNSLLVNLVPPFDDNQQVVGMVSFGTVVVLLALTLGIRKRLTVASVRNIAVVSVVAFLAALFVFFSLRHLTLEYIYRYPPASISSANQSRHLRGDLHAKGRERVKDLTVAQAVYQLGGPDEVNARGLLWYENSRLAIAEKMEWLYAALTILLTSAIFVAGIAVWRKQQGS